MSDIEKRFPFDAYCLHLGPDIAAGGTVAEDCIALNRTARLRAWPTVERAGAISVWHAEASAEPEWELPKIPDRPQLARGEGAITEFRAWARQSYEEAYA